MLDIKWINKGVSRQRDPVRGVTIIHVHTFHLNVGSAYALELIINIESYEHMAGYHDDIGIKVNNSYNIDNKLMHSYTLESVILDHKI